jgi:uroporphyrinogen decarboxylase
MTPLERVRATLRREPTDRPPVDLWLTPEVLADLKSHTGQEDELAVYSALGVDKIVWVFPGYDSAQFDPNHSEGIDPWGVPTVQVRSGAATYQEYGEGPLSKMDEIAALDDYPLWPEPDRFQCGAAMDLARRAREHGFATTGPWVSHFEIYCHMRGMENALMDVVAEPDFLDAALDRIEEVQTRLLDRFLREAGDLIDMVFISDDLGTQESQLLSVPAFEAHLKPRIRRWCDLIHRHGKKVLFHTDGASRSFLPHLAQCGVDILNPIQHVCPGMETAALKRDFGEMFIFHGGIENQQVLPRGTTSEVRDEVRRCMETLGRNGGYIVCSCHNIQAGTPTANVLAMIEAVREAAR